MTSVTSKDSSGIGEKTLRSKEGAAKGDGGQGSALPAHLQLHPGPRSETQKGSGAFLLEGEGVCVKTYRRNGSQSEEEEEDKRSHGGLSR